MTTTRPSTAADAVGLRSPELEAIRQVIECYASAQRTGSPEALSRAFHPRAVIVGYLDDDLLLMDMHVLEGHVRSMDPPAGTGEAYRHELQSVLMTGRIATVEIFEYSLFGHDFRTCFHMARIEDRWQITAKLFTSLGAAAHEPDHGQV